MSSEVDVEVPGLSTPELAAAVVDYAAQVLSIEIPELESSPILASAVLEGAPTQVLDVDEPEGPSAFTSTTADREHQPVEYVSLFTSCRSPYSAALHLFIETNVYLFTIVERNRLRQV